MKKYDFCPNCSIGLNSREMELGFCQNCKHDWTDEDDFQCCDKTSGRSYKTHKKKMAKEAKFKIGDLVRHRAAQKHNAKKMIVTATGSLKNEDGETNIYQLSGEKESYVAKDDTFFRVVLEEVEIELFDK